MQLTIPNEVGASCGRPYLEVAVTTKYKSGRISCSALTTASFPTPLGPLMTSTIGLASGTCIIAGC